MDSFCTLLQGGSFPCGHCNFASDTCPLPLALELLADKVPRALPLCYAFSVIIDVPFPIHINGNTKCPLPFRRPIGEKNSTAVLSSASHIVKPQSNLSGLDLFMNTPTVQETSATTSSGPYWSVNKDRHKQTCVLKLKWTPGFFNERWNVHDRLNIGQWKICWFWLPLTSMGGLLLF